MGDKNREIIILQNELSNVVLNTMKAHNLGEDDMYLVIQGMALKLMQMLMTRLQYGIKEKDNQLAGGEK